MQLKYNFTPDLFSEMALLSGIKFNQQFDGLDYLILHYLY